ncbi:MAG: RDD family protein, partial [Deltaproteobacteria bacterium]
RGHIMLADFGLARLAIGTDGSLPPGAPSGNTDSMLTRAGAIVGTPAYLAPEQADGAFVDHRADLYSLGVTLFESLTGKLPFKADHALALLDEHRRTPPPSPRSLAPALAPSIDRLVLRMLEKRPDARFATYGDLREAIAGAREKPRVAASLTSRATAALIDLPILVIIGMAMAAIHAGLQWPVLAVAIGLTEGRYRATPGKRLLRLATVGPHGEPIGVPRGIARALVKMWGLIGIHVVDLAVRDGAVRVVATTVIGLAWAAGWLAVLFGPKLTLHDRVAGSRVVYWLETGAAKR